MAAYAQMRAEKAIESGDPQIEETGRQFGEQSILVVLKSQRSLKQGLPSTNQLPSLSHLETEMLLASTWRLFFCLIP